MSKILYEVYQNDIKDSESAMYGKWYARLKSIETLSMTKVAKHIAEHGSVFTEDVVEGVLKKFKNCLLEMLLDSKKVKIAGLGTFYLTAECTKGGADKEEDFNVNQHLSALHIRFLPDQAAEDNISSREFIKKAEFINVKSLLSNGSDDEDETEDENGSGNGQNAEQPTGYALTISTSGSGTSTITLNGNALTSGASLSENDEVQISITPATGQTPTATLNGSPISLTENSGVYTGSFQMPAQASTLAINSGTSDGGNDDDDLIQN